MAQQPQQAEQRQELPLAPVMQQVKLERKQMGMLLCAILAAGTSIRGASPEDVMRRYQELWNIQFPHG